jgi:hypothetical protein
LKSGALQSAAISLAAELKASVIIGIAGIPAFSRMIASIVD